jgi:hypothetical protein
MTDRPAFARERLISLIIDVGMLRRDVATNVADAILSRADSPIQDLRAVLRDLVMLERVVTPDMSGKRRAYAHMQNGSVLAETLDRARAVLETT